MRERRGQDQRQRRQHQETHVGNCARGVETLLLVVEAAEEETAPQDEQHIGEHRSQERRLSNFWVKKSDTFWDRALTSRMFETHQHSLEKICFVSGSPPFPSSLFTFTCICGLSGWSYMGQKNTVIHPPPNETTRNSSASVKDLSKKIYQKLSFPKSSTINSSRTSFGSPAGKISEMSRWSESDGQFCTGLRSLRPCRRSSAVYPCCRRKFNCTTMKAVLTPQ